MPTTAGRRQRDAELARIQQKGVQPLPAAPMTLKTVGTSWIPAYPDSFLDLQQLLFQRDGDEPIELRRRPDNQHDANAVEVHVPLLGERSMVGHIPAVTAARLAPELDAGVEWAGYVHNILVSPHNPTQPGIEITIQRANVQQSLDPREGALDVSPEWTI